MSVIQNKRDGKNHEKCVEEEKEIEDHKNTSSPTKVSTRIRKRRNTNTFDDIGVCYDEEKMLGLALKNSLRDQKASTAKDCSKVRQMKEFRPTEEEFLDPIKYFEDLYHKGVWRYG